MFIYTVKASRIKYFALIISSMAILLTLASVVPKEKNFQSVAVVSYDFSNVYTNEDRVDFLESFGYTVDAAPLEVVSVAIPSSFDSVYEKYNDIQRAQGLNLKRYAGKSVTRYTYKVSEYGDKDSAVVANLLVYNNSIIGGDVCSTENNSFIHGFKKPDDV